MAATPVFLPGDSHGGRSLVGYNPQGRKSQTRLSNFTTSLKRTTPRHIVIKMTKMRNKERILKQQGKSNKLHSREHPFSNQLTFQQKFYRLEDNGMIQLWVMKGKNLEPRVFYPPRLSFRFDRKIKNFTYKQNLSSASSNQHYKKCLRYFSKWKKKRPQLETWKL